MMIHADRFSFEVTGKATGTGSVDELSPGEDRGEVDDALVAFISVETVDESAPHDVAEQAAAQISTTADKVGAARVMVYPYAHLSNDLATPRIATKVIAEVFEHFRANVGLEVHRAPFGYYKAFEIACKGHPLSELAMTLVPADHATERAPMEATAES